MSDPIVKIAISKTRSPLNGRFIRNRRTCAEVVSLVKATGDKRVDLVIEREGGPYIRMRMNAEGVRLLIEDLQRAEIEAFAP